MQSLKKSLKWKRETQIPENTSYKMNFLPEHAEDIVNVYVVNQILESVSSLYAKKQISKEIGPYLWHYFCAVFLCVPLIKRWCIAVFLSIKLKKKNASHKAVFGCATGNIYLLCLSSLTCLDTICIYLDIKFKGIDRWKF